MVLICEFIHTDENCILILSCKYVYSQSIISSLNIQIVDIAQLHNYA